MTKNRDTITTTEPDRPVRPALVCGWRMKCPNCGVGSMMRAYLKTHDECVVCGEELHHHRADDGPAYVTILVTGHVLAPLILLIFTKFRPDPLVLGGGLSLAFVALALFLLPRFKGMFVALQWANRMHGFAMDPADRTGD